MKKINIHYFLNTNQWTQLDDILCDRVEIWSCRDGRIDNHCSLQIKIYDDNCFNLKLLRLQMDPTMEQMTS